jgi:hypothetical protein
MNPQRVSSIGRVLATGMSAAALRVSQNRAQIETNDQKLAEPEYEIVDRPNGFLTSLESLSEQSRVISCPTRAETKACLDMIHENPDVLQDILPSYFSTHQREAVIKGALQLSRNETLMNSLHLKLSSGCNSQEQPELKSEVADNNAIQFWQQLQTKFPCGICRDVLAAPILLPCSHSFCGSCVQDLISSCEIIPTSSGSVFSGRTGTAEPEVVSACPVCRQEISNRPIFERNLAAVIEAEVQQMRGDCQGKEDWLERQRSYEKAREAAAVAAAKHATNTTTTGFGTGTRRRGEHGEVDADDRNNSSSWEEMMMGAGGESAWVYPVILFVVTALLVAARYCCKR